MRLENPHLDVINDGKTWLVILECGHWLTMAPQPFRDQYSNGVPTRCHQCPGSTDTRFLKVLSRVPETGGAMWRAEA